MKTTLETAQDLIKYYGGKEGYEGLVANAVRIIKEEGGQVIKLMQGETREGLSASDFDDINAGKLFVVERETKCFYFVKESFKRGSHCLRRICKKHLHQVTNSNNTIRFIYA